MEIMSSLRRYVVVPENGWIAKSVCGLGKEEIPALEGNQIPVSQPRSVRIFRFTTVIATK